MAHELVLADPAARQIGAAPAAFACTLTDDGVHRACVHVAGELDIATTPRLEYLSAKSPTRSAAYRW